MKKFSRILALVSLIVFIGTQIWMRESYKKTLVEIEENHVIRLEEEAKREAEREAGGAIYKISDIDPEETKPSGWRKFYVPKNIPEGYVYWRDGFSKNNYQTAVSLIFREWKTDGENEKKKLYFIQSKNRIYDDEHRYVKERKKREDGIHYFATEDGMNVIYWFDGNITFYVKGEISIPKLKWFAEQIIVYDKKMV